MICQKTMIAFVPPYRSTPLTHGLIKQNPYIEPWSLPFEMIKKTDKKIL